MNRPLSDPQHAFLALVAEGFSYVEAAGRVGDDGHAAGLACAIQGWLADGKLSQAGRAALEQERARRSRSSKVLDVTDLRTGRKL